MAQGQEKKRIVLEETLEFKGTIDTQMTTTSEIGKLVNGLMDATFDDYEGCYVMPNQSGTLDIALYFNFLPNAMGVKAIEGVGQATQHMTAASRIMNFNQTRSNRTIQLTEDGKELLESVVRKHGGKPVNWGMISAETVDQNAGISKICMKVCDIDVNKILKIVYGGDGYEYNINLIRPIPQTNNFLISVQRLSNGEVENLCRSLGMMLQTGSIPMNRERF